MFKSKTELLEWHRKGIVTTFTAAVYLIVKYHTNPLKLLRVI
jgi:hypothetical protein